MPGTMPRPANRNRERALWLGLQKAGGLQNGLGAALEGVVSPVAAALWRRTISRASAVTVEAQANMPIERPDAVVIPMGLDTDLFSPDGMAAIPGRVVAVGGLWPRKGFDILIKALALAARDVKALHVVIAGEGHEMEALTRLASELGVAEHVSLVGRIRRDELPTLYRSAMVACHPARFDNYPTALIEAMSCGVPVLVSEMGSMPEIVGDAGMIHRVGDIEALGRQLVEITTNPALRRQLAAEARSRALARHALGVMCDAYLDLYRRTNS
jgi:glycosyltransferase involved in cell wall biosynthesis